MEWEKVKTKDNIIWKPNNEKKPRIILKKPEEIKEENKTKKDFWIIYLEDEMGIQYPLPNSKQSTKKEGEEFVEEVVKYSVFDENDTIEEVNKKIKKYKSY